MITDAASAPGPAELSALTEPTEFLDYEHPDVQDFLAHSGIDPSTPPAEQAVRLYYAVRDGIHYEVYGTGLSREALRASSVARAGQGFCLHKSVLYAAAVRAVGVPSRLVYADVRNHLASERLKRMVGGEVFHHGLVSVHLGGRWLRVTPVFNALLCRLYGMTPLEFDGTASSTYHPYDADGDDGKRMEFLRDYGAYDDLPYELLMERMRVRHPGMFAGGDTVVGTGSLADEAPGLPAADGSGPDGSGPGGTSGPGGASEGDGASVVGRIPGPRGPRPVA
ncbi:transglutaminase-like domain-containing protein [Streptomyces pathocidini]|uniref:transglutaminase-like domain-containing protein n=1 Tax=Streptomyces pathocidini TaxID=1650571 RepID=UPI0033D734FA